MKAMPKNARNQPARPRVICLMQTSVDAKIINDRWPDPSAAEGEFEAMHERGLKVSTWTVDDPAEMRRVIDAGVDAVITNRIAELVALLAEARC